MSRADRLFRIVDQLRRHRFLTAAQLAERLEVSVRTVYRDVLDLQASGVPVSGEAGVGYRLDEGYDLPPLMFSRHEVEALVLGMRMVESWGDRELRASARGIVDKVNAVITGEARSQLGATALFSLSFSRGERASEHLGELRGAVNERRVVSFDYRDEQGRETRRAVRPLGLYFWGHAWTLAAYCELREDFRNFRADRLANVEVLARTFCAEPPCTLADYLVATRARDRNPQP